MNKNVIDRTGQKINCLTFIRYVGNRKWLFRCDCGNEKEIRTQNVLEGKIKSCGCLPKPINKGRLEHGLYGTRFYWIWHAIKQRCLDTNHPLYYNCGGRGIKICDSWLLFNNFKNDMYESYLEHSEKFGEKQTTILRKNPNLNYDVDNCIWGTMKEQAANRRERKIFKSKRNINITINEETHCLAEWCEIYNKRYDLVYCRIKRLKWDAEKALLN